MSASADAVVIGGGVVGASIAYHLARRGMRRVVLVERDRLGSGSTGKNAGGVRLQFSTEINVRLSLRSIERFERFAEEIGVDPAFQQVGYLFLITREHDVGPFERSLALWERLGVPGRRLDREAVGALFPGLLVDDVILATYCPRDGYLDPHSVLRGYVARAREMGVEVRENAPVTAIERGRGRIEAVVAGGERIATDTVVNAAGAWAAEVGRLVGVDLPIAPMRRQIVVTGSVAGLPAEFPLTVEFESGLYMHRESGGVLLGMGDPRDRPGHDDSVNWDFVPDIAQQAIRRLPALERASIRAAWGGLYEDTPDKHPIVGPVGDVAGSICAAGFSGHGVMHAPATGELVSELIVDGAPSLDLAPLGARRFAEGRAIPEHNVI